MKVYDVTRTTKSGKTKTVARKVEAKSQAEAIRKGYGCNNGKTRVYKTKKGATIRAIEVA